ncbi:MAG: glutathione S-transferase [Beijerinckiaceae bacterium]
MTYELYYWPTIQGRGEFVRLALEEAGARYVDIARGRKQDGQGVAAMQASIADRDLEHPPFAPPFLKDGDLVIAQTAAILLYLGDKHRLAPKNTAGRLWTHQIQLTIADLVVEAHDAHHPIASGLYYEDQKDEAARRAEDFRESRVPKYLDWFERILTRNPTGPKHLVGGKITYADLSLFQVIAGLNYAFPKLMQRALRKHPHVAALHEAVAKRARIKAYLQSPRRIAFNESGIFRHYPELDA